MTTTVEEKKESLPPEESPASSGLTRANNVQKVLAVGIAAIAVLAVSLIVHRVASSSGKNYSGAVTTQYQILVRIDGGPDKPPLPGMTADLRIKN